MASPLDLAARALQRGDALTALKHAALGDAPAALALRGIAFAQLGDHARARRLLQRAERGFGEASPLARARCAAALCELALAARATRFPERALTLAHATFVAHGERGNALYVRLIALQRAFLVGRIVRVEQELAQLDLRGAPAALVARARLAAFELAIRRGNTAIARTALAQALQAADTAQIPALVDEVELAGNKLSMPVARLLRAGDARPITLAEVEALLVSNTLVVDACRRSLSRGRRFVTLARRPVLFALLAALAERSPEAQTRERLIQNAFGIRRATPSLRARLRVEMGRLRKLLRGFAELAATAEGYRLVPMRGASVASLLPPTEGADAALCALLADGAGWSSSALAQALGENQRTVQRALSGLSERGLVQSFGSGRHKRWVAPPELAFTTAMLLVPPRAVG